METMLAEAYSNEEGKDSDGLLGDQGEPGNTGKPSNGGEEVRVKHWYKRSGGWEVCLECTEEDLANAAAEIAARIANDNSFGYDQQQRKTAYKAILAAGSIEAAEDSALDCSVLVFIAYILAGLEIEIGFTGNLESWFMATGKFIAHRDPVYLESGDYAKPGWIYLTAGKHTAIVVSSESAETPVIELPNEEVPADDYSGEADEIDPPYVQSIGTVRVRKMAGKPKVTADMDEDQKRIEQDEHARIYTTSDGERLPYLGSCAENGWYYVETPNGKGYISNKAKYSILVTE